MPFSTLTWVPVGDSPSIKRRRSGSGLSSNMRASKRSKRSLSASDKSMAEQELDSSTKQCLSGQTLLLINATKQTVAFRDVFPAEDSPGDDFAFHSVPTGPASEREASAATSTSSGLTMLASEDTVSSDQHNCSKKLDKDYVMTDFNVDEALPRRGPAAPIFDKFLELPRKLQVAILKETMSTAKFYKPYYQEGMLKGYIVNNAEDATFEPVTDEATKATYVVGANIGIYKPALVSKKFADVYLEAFYSHHTFGFEDPGAAMWFLKKIGGNLSYLRTVQLIMYSGFLGKNQGFVEGNNLVNESLEELWYGVLCFLQYRQKFDKLIIIPFKWATEAEMYRNKAHYKVDDDGIANIMRYRGLIYHKLERTHGIKKVQIKDPSRGLRESLPPGADIAQLTLQMQQCWPAERPKDKRKTPLAELLKASRKNVKANTGDELSKEEARSVVGDMAQETTHRSTGIPAGKLFSIRSGKEKSKGGKHAKQESGNQNDNSQEPGRPRAPLEYVNSASETNAQHISASNNDQYRPSDSSDHPRLHGSNLAQFTSARRVSSMTARRNASIFGRHGNRQTYGSQRYNMPNLYERVEEEADLH